MFIGIQVSLLLEYCSKGDLKSFLVDHRKEFNDSLNDFQKTGVSNKSIPKSSVNQVLDIKILHRWAFQVKIFRCLYCIYNPNEIPRLENMTLKSAILSDCRWDGIFNWKRNVPWRSSYKKCSSYRFTGRQNIRFWTFSSALLQSQRTSGTQI